MAYAKTDADRARFAKRREGMLKAALAVIESKGIAGATADAIAAKAGCTKGALYKPEYFADMAELLTTAAYYAFEQDRLALRLAEAFVTGTIATTPRDRLSAALFSLSQSLGKPKLARFLLEDPVYRYGMLDEITPLIQELVALPVAERKAAASAILGILYGVVALDGGTAHQAIALAFRSLGVRETARA